MIETKEHYETLKAIADIGGFQGAGDLKYAMDTIEALREVARAANEMNEADQLDEGVIFFNKVLPALDALPDWIMEEPK